MPPAPKVRRGPIELKTWLAECKAQGVRPIPPDDPVFAYAARVGIDREVLDLHWWVFKRSRLEAGKRQSDWRACFRNSVRQCWFRLWFLAPGQPCRLTTAGLQAQAEMLAEQEDRARAAQQAQAERERQPELLGEDER